MPSLFIARGKESSETRIQFWFHAADLTASNQIAERCHIIKASHKKIVMLNRSLCTLLQQEYEMPKFIVVGQTADVIR